MPGPANINNGPAWFQLLFVAVDSGLKGILFIHLTIISFRHKKAEKIMH
jgi:hypothetical protein